MLPDCFRERPCLSTATLFPGIRWIARSIGRFGHSIAHLGLSFGSVRIGARCSGSGGACRRLLPGMAADIVAFDFNAVGSDKRGQMRDDLPGDRRLVNAARCIEHVFVNGEWLYDRGRTNQQLYAELLGSGNC
jgi:hypothetical protein